MIDVFQDWVGSVNLLYKLQLQGDLHIRGDKGKERQDAPRIAIQQKMRAFAETARKRLPGKRWRFELIHSGGVIGAILARETEGTYPFAVEVFYPSGPASFDGRHDGFDGTPTGLREDRRYFNEIANMINSSAVTALGEAIKKRAEERGKE
jgi:hypothetical protein